LAANLFAVSGTPALAGDGSFQLSDLDGSNGFTMLGTGFLGDSGRSASGVGDFNGDGVDDLIIGANGVDPGGAIYVVFGSLDPFSPTLELSELDGTNGFALHGIDPGDNAGFSVSGAGDFNGDGLSDLLIGAYGADTMSGAQSGESYIVFGTSDLLPGQLELSDLPASRGFRIVGMNDNDLFGTSVSGTGDVNGDGLDDVIIGAKWADTWRGGIHTGESYIIFGHSNDLPSTLRVSNLDGTHGFGLPGVDGDDDSGTSVSGAGDVNGDGFDDFVIGASRANDLAGESYLVFGTSEPRPDRVELATLDGTDGLTIVGVSPGDESGHSVSGAGDLNADGIDDLVIGAPFAGPDNSFAGKSYVVFGSLEPFPARLELSTLDGTHGFSILGIESEDETGWSVSAAGDINADGVDDLILGATSRFSLGGTGDSYVLFGTANPWPSNVDLSLLDGARGFVLHGVDAADFSGWSVSSAGDVNGDGVDDILIGAPGADPDLTSSGETYVVFGGTQF